MGAAFCLFVAVNSTFVSVNSVGIKLFLFLCAKYFNVINYDINKVCDTSFGGRSFGSGGSYSYCFG
jgi:hypothetical protein